MRLKVIVFEGVQNIPILAAQKSGYFLSAGLDVELHYAENSQTLRNGVADRLFDIAHTAVDNAVAMVELTGAPVTVFMGGDNGFNHLVTRPETRSVSDLAGQTVLVDAPNTAFALVLYAILERAGLDRSSYVVEPVGATPLRLQRMLTDTSAAAAIMNLPYYLQARSGGLRDHGKVTDSIGPYLSTCGFGLSQTLREKRALIVGYVQAYIRGLRWCLDYQNREGSIDLLVNALGIDHDLARQAMEVATDPVEGFSADAVIDRKGLQNVLKLRADMEGQWGGKTPDPSKYIDERYLSAAMVGL